MFEFVSVSVCVSVCVSACVSFCVHACSQVTKILRNSLISIRTFLIEWCKPLFLLLYHDLNFQGQSSGIFLNLRISSIRGEI